MKSELKLAHQPCPCGKSSDAYSTYTDGHGFCFSCSKSYHSTDRGKQIELVDGVKTYEYHAHRGISAKTFEFYNVYTEFVDGQPNKVGFIYPNNAIKFRSYEEKAFFSEGPMSDAGCFGTDKFDRGSKSSITLFEGEYDALAGYEILRGDSACISIRSASSAKRDVVRDWDYINSFGRIVIAFDSDEAGRSAARAVAPLFDYAKVYHVDLNRHKDANAYLEAGEANEFEGAWKAAKRYAPDNIISTYEEFARSLVQTKDDVLATLPFPTLQNRLYGLLSGRVYVFKGLEGIGKTEIFRAMEYHVLSTTKHNIGVLHLEEDNGTTIKALAGYTLKVPTVAPDSSVSNDEIMAAIKKLTKDDVLATLPFPTLQNRLYGLLSGRVYVFKGLEGIGKTEIFRAMEYHVLSTTKHNIGVLHLEEDNGTTIKALAGYTLKVPTVAPDSSVSNDEIMAAIKKLTKDDEGRLHIHEAWDVEDEDAILDTIRFLASAVGCRLIFLDHISWLATGLDADDDERRKLDRISQKLKLLAKELKIAIIEISHVNDSGQTRGSRNITKNADVVVHMSRNITSSDETERNTINLMVEKARLGGNTGPAGSLVFDRETFTLREKERVDEIKVPNLIP